MARMDTLAAARDFEELRRQAHSLKGSSMVVGAGRAAALCREIETRASACQPPGTMLQDLHGAVEETEFAWARLAPERQES